VPEAIYDAHIYIGIAAEDEQREGQDGDLRPVKLGLDIRRTLDLGRYPLEKYAELIDMLEVHIEAWVEANPSE
jgi:hypothetical protein